MKIEELKAYEVIEARRIEDVHSDSYLLKHKKTGARVALLSNQDDNKVFYVGFRTPPGDSTGVAHILEHSVLCGSKEFPVKDPFIELAKGSLNTFLNAMTFPDKTVYPVASCNDKDFQNLMHVYLDSVFYPNIYKTDKIFAQEGWHYELENLEDELTINGVVYNEMKGAFSSPDDVLMREIMNSLYPDTTYGNESGGDPEDIPNLTYEDFLAFHQKYYHPSNSYIYLYGDMDMVEKLEFIDKEYLSKFDALEVDSEVKTQKAFEECPRLVKEYPIDMEEEEGEKTYLSLNYSVGDSLDKELYVAFKIIDFALCSAPGAPLKQALTDKNIGKDVFGYYDNGIKQPMFSIIAKDTDEDREEEFLQTIKEVLEKVCKEGFDKKALQAGLHHFEFRHREADFGSYPKGLIYGLEMLDSWLYDEEKAYLHMEANETFEVLKKKIKNDYFENLVKTYLLDNTHKTILVLKPKKGLAEEKEEALKNKLARKKAGMTKEELLQIMEETKALEAYQEEEESPENLAKIPLLKREDIGTKARPIINEERKMKDVPVLYHNIESNGIGYLRFVFKIQDLPERLYPYVNLLKNCLGMVNTKNYSYGELFNEMNLITGSMGCVSNLYGSNENREEYLLTLDMKAKALYQNMDKAIALMEEIILTSDFNDYKRLREIIAERKSQMVGDLMGSGHSIAVGRALSYGSKMGVVNEVTGGMDYFRFVCDLDANFEERKEELARSLKELTEFVFRKENLLVDFTGSEEGYALLPESVERFVSTLYTTPVEKGVFTKGPSKKNEGYMSAGAVQYVCRAGNFKDKGLPYTGVLRVLKVMLGYEYLWTNVRVKGGAYGCMCGFARNGESYFVSYRDPNLEKTIDIYEKAVEAIASYEADERTMTQYIIGAISDLDLPMNPSAHGTYSLVAYMKGITQEMVQLERDEVLSADAESLSKMSEYVKAFLADDFLCVVGNAGKVKEQKELFLQVENLI